MKLSQLRSQSGQMIIESILIMAILLGVTTMTTRYLRDNETIAQLITGPWDMLAGMIQNGVWAPQDKAKVLHPNFQGRGASLQGSSAR